MSIHLPEPTAGGRRRGRRRAAMAVAAALAATGVAALDAAAIGPRAAAVTAVTPLLHLDATNPASYPGSGTAWNDLSGNGRHGTISGTGITYSPTTQAMQFPGGTNGTAWVALAGTYSDFSAGLTLAFEGEFGATRAPWERIFDFALGVGSTADDIWVGQQGATNELGMEVWNGGTSQGYCSTSTGGTALGTLGSRAFAKWVVTLGDVGGTNTCRIYKDGVELSTQYRLPDTTPSGSPSANGVAYPLPGVSSRPSAFLGRSNFSADQDFEGSIRTLRIYDQALTPAQVEAEAEATVTFDGNGGTGTMAAQTSTVSAALTANAFARRGFTFVGWNTAANGTGTAYADGAAYAFSSSATLYAQWLPVVGVRYVSLPPERLFDSRESTPIVGGAEPREVAVAGLHGVPADATAVVLNVTATGPTADGYVTVYPCGQDRPGTSSVNFAKDQVVANSATVTLVTDKVCVYSLVTTDVVLDVNGAYSPTSGTGLLTTFAPKRLLDTRVAGTALAALTPKAITVADATDVPVDATAVVVTVTATEPEAAGYVTAYPCGETAPLASNLNFVAGQTVPNQATVKIGAQGTICVVSSVATHLVVDVNAAFSPTGASEYDALTPDRVVDTRKTTRLAAGVPFELTVAGVAGIDADADAVALNVTVTGPAAAGYLTSYPCGGTVPLASNLNFVADQTVANAVIAEVVGGKVCFVSTAATDLVVDVSGQFLVIVPG